MLAPDTETPPVPETTVCTDLLQTLQVVTELRVDSVRENLAVFAVDDVALPVQEPDGNLELSGVLDDSDETLELIRVEVASAANEEYSMNDRLQLEDGVRRTVC